MRERECVCVREGEREREREVWEDRHSHLTHLNATGKDVTSSMNKTSMFRYDKLRQLHTWMDSRTSGGARSNWKVVYHVGSGSFPWSPVAVISR